MDCKNLSLTKAVSRDNLALVRSTTEVGGGDGYDGV
jgi:hypothetical protein